MRYLIELMNARHMSRTDLSDLSGVPESTLRDILTGKAQLDRCEAATLYSIAEALDVSIEDILLSYWDELEEANAPDTFAVHEEGTLMPFYLLVDATLSKLHKEGDLAVIRHIRANEWIEQFWDGGLYRAALFLLGLTDYLCRRNGVKPDSKFDACRNARLDRAVYALRTLEENDDACAFEEARCYAENNAIPELTRFNIYMTEDDIRQMA